MSKESAIQRFSLCFVACMALLSQSQAARANSSERLAPLIEALASDPGLSRSVEALAKEMKLKDLPFLIKAGSDKRPLVRAGILKCLCYLRGYPAPEPPDVRGFILRSMQDKDTLVRQQAVWASMKFAADSPELIKALIKALDDDARPKNYPTMSVACVAADVLPALGAAARPAYPALIRTAQRHPDDDTRRSAILALGRLARDDSSQRPLLLQTLLDLARHEKADWARRYAIGSLANIGKEAEPLVPALRKIWQKEVLKKDRANALLLHAMVQVYTYIGVGAKAALPEVLVVLQDTKANERMRRDALSFVVCLGKDAKAALPLVRKIANSQAESFEMRRVADFTLKELAK